MFGINKNGTKHKVGIIMPAFFPASRTTYDGTTSGLSETRVQGAIDAVEGQIANSSDAYSASKDYAVGDYCIYNDTLYRCVTACSAASWSVNSSCFTADTVVGAINEVSSIQRSVSVVADGVKTYAQILTELYALIDISKVTPKSILYTPPITCQNSGGTSTDPLYMGGVLSPGSTRVDLRCMRLSSDTSYSGYHETYIQSGSITQKDRSSSVVTQGWVFEFIY